MDSGSLRFNSINLINDPLKYLFSAFFLLIVQAGSAQRILTSIDQGWRFSKANEQDQTVMVNLPHTWNTRDVMDDVAGYYRGKATYIKQLHLREKNKGKQYFLHIEAANQVAEVYVNGKNAGSHTGGYAAFYLPVKHLLKEGVNEVLVEVNNAHDQDIPPLSADFTFYGGLYRNVWLIETSSIHFSFQDQNKGIYIRTPVVNEQEAVVNISALLSNDWGTNKQVRMRHVLRDRTGKVVAAMMQDTIIPATTDAIAMNASISLAKPRLWSPENPYLYRLTSELLDAASGKVIDKLEHPVGLRYFHFDAAKGFFLNGKSYKLVGTSRHQDYAGLGNAVPEALAIRDIQLIKEMGGNFLRVAHYPQDDAVLAACDSLGILASVEIPVVNEISETKAFANHAIQMQEEMIRQHVNHPSVIIWCYMNEVLLRPHYNQDKLRQQTYFRSIEALAKKLDSVTRKADPSRYTMMAHHGDYNKYKEVGLVAIPMIVGWNLYSGWYGANLSDFPKFLDSFHARHPDKILVVSEYGADADPRISSVNPVRFDKSVEYTTAFHQFYWKSMKDRPFVAAAMIWNLADFNSETRTETMPHINNKGLLEWNRSYKDPYYYYKAMLWQQPFIKLLGLYAGGKKSSGHVYRYIRKQIEVATNMEMAELFVNGVSQGKRSPDNGICRWETPTQEGNVQVEVKAVYKGKSVSDRATIHFMPAPTAASYFQYAGEMNILLGGNRYFTDGWGRLWLPSAPFIAGATGHVGGKAFRIPNNGRLPYGTDKNIIGTDDDPIYQTQQVGIQSYELQLPAGKYELALHFAELLGGTVKELPYNLDDPERIEPRGKRIFNVYLNNQLWLDNLDLSGQFGPATAVVKKTIMQVTGSEGITIGFKAIEGEPVLNAVQIRKMDSFK